MTTGTVTCYDPRNGTGTVSCPSGADFPFTARGAALTVGDPVAFLATGGLAGVYALHVRRIGPDRPRPVVHLARVPVSAARMAA